MKNTYLIIAGSLNLFTAFVHLIGGQSSLVNPMLESNLSSLEKAQQLGVWHMITMLLFYSSIILLQKGFKVNYNSKGIIKFIGISYVLYGLCFIGGSLYQMQLALQWTLLLPIGILTLLGEKKIA